MNKNKCLIEEILKWTYTIYGKKEEWNKKREREKVKRKDEFERSNPWWVRGK